MFTVPVEVAESAIQGKGVFSCKDIAKGTKVWIFQEDHDARLTPEEQEALPSVIKAYIFRTGYLSPWSGYFVMPPIDDPAQFINHSRQPNMSAVYDEAFSEEPYFVANRIIKAGEELTDNYLEFDAVIQNSRPDWV